MTDSPNYDRRRAERIDALASFLVMGPGYRRGVADNVRWSETATGRADREHWLLVAERCAGLITRDQLNDRTPFAPGITDDR